MTWPAPASQSTAAVDADGRLVRAVLVEDRGGAGGEGVLRVDQRAAAGRSRPRPASAASAACSNVSASTTAIGSPTKRTLPSASGARTKSACTWTKPWCGATPRLSAVSIATTPGAASASSTWIASSTPWATSERTNTACSEPGTWQVGEVPVLPARAARDPRCAARVSRGSSRRDGRSPASRHHPATDHPRNRVSLRHGRPLASASCCGSYCPRVHSRRRRSSCSRPPTCTSCGHRRRLPATIDDPRIDHVRILRPQEIPVYVAEGLVRRRHHRSRLGRGDLERRRHPRRAALLQGDVGPDPHGRGGRRRLAGQPRVRARRRRARVVGVPAAHPALLRRAGRRRRRAASATARARPRSPTSPTAWWRSPRPGGPCVRPGSR